MIDDVLNRGTSYVTAQTGSTATKVGDLVERSAVEATGSATRVTDRAGRTPAIAVAVLLLAALGGIVVMRRVFAGAIS